jgi:hypothetical protein
MFRMGLMIQQTSTTCNACSGVGKEGSTVTVNCMKEINVEKGTKKGNKIVLKTKEISTLPTIQRVMM